MSDLLTLSANNLIVLAAGFMLWRVGAWQRASTFYDSRLREAFYSGVLLVLAVSIRVGWWSLALTHAPPGEAYHPWFTEYKHIPTVVSSLLFAWGALTFVSTAEARGAAWRTKHLLLLVGLTFCTILLTVLIR